LLVYLQIMEVVKITVKVYFKRIVAYTVGSITDFAWLLGATLVSSITGSVFQHNLLISTLNTSELIRVQ
jgi:hypothetical protein